MRFYNTTHLSGDLLKEAKRSASCQKDFVLRIMQHYDALSPSQAYELAIKAGIPCTINGVRASFTFLTKDGYFVKTDEKVDGPTGRPEYLWRSAVGDGCQLGLWNGGGE